MKLSFVQLALFAAVAGAPSSANADGTCEDDVYWVFHHKKNKRARYCRDVERKPQKFCPTIGLDGRSGAEACPRACGSCTDIDDEEDGAPGMCENDQSWRITSKNGRRIRDCDWVSRRPDKFCSLRGDDGRLASDACFNECGCPDDEDTPNNDYPTKQPTPAPTPARTDRPTPSPTPPPTPANNPTSSYNIEFDMIGVGRAELYTDARNMWESVITGDIPDNSFLGGQSHQSSGCAPYPSVIDDLHICAKEVGIDGPGGVLGRAGADWIRTGSGLALSGTMEFDRVDVNAYSDKSWAAVIKHEMGHIIGISGSWSRQGYGTNVVSNNVYIGAKGLDVWNNDWGCVGTPPIETDGGSGTAGGHWDEVCFGSELMTGYINTWGSASNPLSQLSIAALSDMGYDVDFSQADSSYRPYSSCCQNGGRRKLAKNLRGLQEGEEGIENVKDLSEAGYALAEEYGRMALTEKKATAPKERIQGDLVYVGDLFTSVIVEEEGELFEVEVYA